jgi:uncharacterized repeat protein (TIGR01451 family)
MQQHPISGISRGRPLFLPILEQLEDRAVPSFALGAAANYAILYEGASSLFTLGTLHIANGTTNVVGSGIAQGGGSGNIGVGGSGFVSVTGGGAAVNGNVDFSASNTGQFSGTPPSGSTNYNVAAVTSALHTVNALNTTLGDLSGTHVFINGNTLINASDGAFSPAGPGYTNIRVFTVTSFNLSSGQTLVINGDASGDSVVLNFRQDTNFDANVILTGGLTPDDVIFNFVGGRNLSGGPDLSFHTGTGGLAQGIFLDPNGPISSNNSNIRGRTFGGDSANFQFNGHSNITAPATIPTPTLTTTPSPATVTLDATTPPILTDSAALSGSNSATGTITFTLVAPGGSPVDTETVTVNGNGTYTTPTGFTLPAPGAITGTYQWIATYSGNTRNIGIRDIDPASEQVTVNAASPTLNTTPTPRIVTLGATPPPLLTDSATLSGGYHPTGAITFNLFHNGGNVPVDTETVAVSGNGTYTTPTGFALPSAGAVIGTYQWDAAYSGNANNHTASDINAANEQVTVKKARPAITTTPNPATVRLVRSTATLTDTADLEGGYHPTGTITFTLFHNGGTTPVDTETVTVNGNGTYTTPTGFRLPTTGSVIGIYQWDATYSGNTNNHAASDINSAKEQVTVKKAIPTITTTPNPATVTLGTHPVTLTDSATLSGGYRPTGTITFSLFHNGGTTPVDTETVTVNGNGTYTTPGGFRLPTTGAVTGTYQWDASYSGNANNHPASDINAPNEQVTVNKASPTITTTPNPTTITLGATTPPILTDSATLSGGYHPTGTVTFTLRAPGGATVTRESVVVKGNGTYTTPRFRLATTGTVTGTYQWDASYSGNANNHPASDANSPNERVTVHAAGPTITTTPRPAKAMQGTTLQDTAILAGGYHETGSVTFRLYAPGVNPIVGPAAYTETVTGVNGNGVYRTTVGFAANASGTWHWVATYNGDPNNNPVASAALDEPVTILEQADLALTKTVSDPAPNVGDTISYTITLADNGPDPATHVTVSDLLPAGVSFVSDTPSQGSYNPATGVWGVGAVDRSKAQTLTITARVVSPHATTNTATISHSDQFDPDKGNNTASATETPQLADLMVTKIVDTPSANVGDAVTFTVTLTDKGPDPATNVTVNDALPSDLTLLSATPSQGSYAGGVWSVGTVSPSVAQTLTITARVDSPNVTINRAAVAHSDQYDPDPGNNIAAATVTPQQADLVVGKRVSNPTPNVGETVTYTVTVTNDGPDTATTVTLQDTLPAEVSFQSFNASKGSYDPTTHSWTIGSVSTGSTETLTITALVVSASPHANTASISHADQFDPNTDNNSDTASIDPHQADLSLAKFVKNPRPNVGQVITFVIRLTNNGFSAATSVRVRDLLPAGLAFVSATPSQGNYNSTTGIWTVGNVSAGATRGLQIQARVNSPNTRTNTATISHSDQSDPDPGNNTASATEIPQKADLAVTKTVDNPNPNVGNIVHFIVTVNDLGPVTATHVDIRDKLPSGLQLLNAAPTQGTYINGLWSVGTVSPSMAQTLNIAARVISPNVTTNTATISHSDQFDPNKANNTASATVKPQNVSDLSVTKTANTNHAGMGQLVTYTITVHNLGPNPAQNVLATDPLPAELTFVAAQASQGTYQADTGQWTIGTMPNAGVAVLRITALVNEVATISNTASVSFPGSDPDLSNNVSMAVIGGLMQDVSKRMLLGSTFGV